MIPPREQEIIRERFAKDLAGRVRLDYFTQKRSSLVVPGREECRFCEDVQTVLTEVAALHPKVSLTVHEFSEAAQEAEKLGVKRVPGTVIRGQANRPLRFYGQPAGWQFANFVEAMTLSSGAHVPVDRDALVAVKKLREPVQVSVLVQPICQPSQLVAHAAYRLALAHTNIRAEAVEIGEFPELANKFDARVTPTTIFGGSLAVRGQISEVEIARLAQQSHGMALMRTIDAGASTPLDPGMFDEQQQPAAAPSAAPGLYIPGR